MKTGRPVSSSYEEFERIVFYAIQRMRYALSGQASVFNAKTALELHLIDGAVEVLSTHDTNVVANFITNLMDYAHIGVNHVTGTGNV